MLYIFPCGAVVGLSFMTRRMELRAMSCRTEAGERESHAITAAMATRDGIECIAAFAT
jgi:hypothetical protein